MVHVLDTWNGPDFVFDCCGIESVWCAFQQHMCGRVRELPAGTQNQHRDRQRQQRIGNDPAMPEDQARCAHRRGRSAQITEHMQPRAAFVERGGAA